MLYDTNNSQIVDWSIFNELFKWESPLSNEYTGKEILPRFFGTISGKIAKDVFEAMWNGEGTPATIIADRGLEQITDDNKIEAVVVQIIDDYSQQVDQYRNGQEKIFGFLVGKVLAETKGKANPKSVNAILRKKLSSS